MNECYCYHSPSQHWCDFGHCEATDCTCDKFVQVEDYDEEPEPHWGFW